MLPSGMDLVFMSLHRSGWITGLALKLFWHTAVHLRLVVARTSAQAVGPSPFKLAHATPAASELRTLTARSWTDCERFAAPLSMRVIGELIGVPTGEGERFRKLVDPLLTRLDPAETDADQSAPSDLLQGLLAGKRQSPGQDLLSLGHLASRRGVRTLPKSPWEKKVRVM
jgi:hypothetical protein